MLDKVRAAIKEYSMLEEGEAVLCCLSGGADSVTLLLCLYELGYKVSAVHVNHHLRGEESDRDESFCRELCKRLGVSFEAVDADVTGYCREKGCSVELGARELRYRIFGSSPIERIATAHTLSDSLETALFNLSRGTAAKGLCGIPPVRGRFVRPLIKCTREEIEKFLSEREQSFVTDSTNLSDDYTRNRVRHSIVPALKSINPDAEHAFMRMSEALRADDEYLCAGAEALLAGAEIPGGYSLGKLSESPQPLLSRAVVRLLTGKGVPYDYARVSEICSLIRSGSGRMSLSGDVFAFASGGAFRIASPAVPETGEIHVSGDCEFSLCGKTVSIKISGNKSDDDKIHRMFTYIALDYDKIKGELVVRTRRSGDYIRLNGRGCGKSIKKLFNESIPLELRESTLLLCDSEGVAAVEGLGLAERCAVDSRTARVLRFGIKYD
ncbi:MAG: tRNA lysidine(34) synthetase TilS [Ruminococcus sp.]|nr:tRNA lysidine(34) synthetase TilS [Ruminococcus sp.]